MEDIFGKVTDTCWNLRVLEVCIEAREKRDTVIFGDVLHSQISESGEEHSRVGGGVAMEVGMK
ncbi:hypothetical protein PVK06_035705 [Gossypium arboreum]|uniref:Uncharacterized protein n=1 Tax=Gossypium arboreum TaxID=29729 RepID=A0ABR0NJT5_GOSAR|nr:hypothetical protein PVK06_035705 [Gossypium arboreum]